MRLLATCGLLVGLLAPFTSQARIEVELVVIGGTAVVGGGVCEGDPDCVSAQPGDTVLVQIDVTLGEGDVLTSVDPSLGYDPLAASLDPKESAESLFAMVNGVLLSPLGLPGIDIVELEPGLADGWELQTSSAAGAAGPAAFSIGRAAFDLSGMSTLVGMRGSMGQPGGTRLTGEGFGLLQPDDVDLGVLRVNVPAPSPSACALATLLVLAALRRPLAAR